MTIGQNIQNWFAACEPGRAPRYQAIADVIDEAIIQGQVASGIKLPPHRSLSDLLGVTAGTVSRAYAELERRGAVMSRVGDGTYVCERCQPAESTASSRLVDLGQNVVSSLSQADALARTLATLGQEPCTLAGLLEYQPEAGRVQHRRIASRWLTRFGFTDEPEQVVLTHGAQHALACLLRLLATPGDVVLCEALSYPSITTLAHQLRLQLISVEIDAEGVVPESLEQACQSYQARVLFCVPTLHNPTTAIMSETRRHQIAAIAKRYKLQIIEDAVPAPILDTQPVALGALLPEQVFFMTSFSKSVAAGLRIGYIRTPRAWLGKLSAILRSNSWMATPLLAEVVSRWMESGQMTELLKEQRQEIQQRHAIARAILGNYLPAAHDHSYHLWLALPEPWRVSDLVYRLRRDEVIVKPADAFTVGRTPAPPSIRLCLSGAPNRAALQDGLQRIRQAFIKGPEGYGN